MARDFFCSVLRAYMFLELQLLYDEHRSAVLRSPFLGIIASHWTTFTVAFRTQPRGVNAIAV